MQTLAQLLGKTRTPLTNLFSLDGRGWNDLVDLSHYPSLSLMLNLLVDKTGLDNDDLKEGPFQLPPSLDDFGLKDFFQEKYPEEYLGYVDQWTDSDEVVVESQIRIQTDFQPSFPVQSKYCLYLLVGNITGTDRVMYVGKAKNGMMTRFFNGPKIAPQNNNYIGDCRSYESHKKPNYTWRAKSAELRRRQISKVVWTTIAPLELDSTESALIIRKRELISEAAGISSVKDPVNSRE